MKKTIISLAVAAGMAASGAAFAASGATVYGNLHLSIDSPDNEGSNTDDLTMKSQTSAIGVKGSEDLGDGLKAFYKVEFQVELDEQNGGKNSAENGTSSLVDRDQYIGLKGGMGTVKFGTTSSNYKQMGGKIDPMYRTSLEGRGTLHMQSPLHGGAGRFGGRMTDILQYASPKMGGMQLVLNTTFDDAETTGGEDIDETIGVGFRYASKSFGAYIDMIDLTGEATATTTWSESATKVGGWFKAGPVKLGLQFEQTEDLLGSDYIMFSANYKINKNNFVYLTMGTRDDYTDPSTDVTVDESASTSFALMYNHKMSKNTNVYIGYGDRDSDVNAVAGKTDGSVAAEGDYSVVTAGMRVKF
ncbi:MAG: porin [Gammaproteobacteria bacterium]|nr:porin [Gammaproteobacteria bacterium]